MPQYSEQDDPHLSIPETDPGKFPPHGTDLVEILAECHYLWRRDAGAECARILRDALDTHPWSQEAADFYGLVMSKIHHIYSPRGLYNLSEWISQQNISKMGGRTHLATMDEWRFRRQFHGIREWIDAGNAGGEEGQWADIADIGAQHGEMLIHFIGIPGAGQGFALELSPSNCHLGHQQFPDPRLHYLTSFAEFLPMRDESVHIAVVSGVLEHVLRPEKLVREAERITKPGGRILIQVPYGGMEGAANRSSDVLSFRSHVQCINPYEILAGKKDLHIEYRSYTNHLHSPHTWFGEVGDFVCWYTKEE